MIQTTLSTQTFGNKNRKPYIKPLIEQVRLAPEEAVLAVCKTLYSGDAGPNSTSVGCGNPPGQCLTDGS